MTSPDRDELGFARYHQPWTRLAWRGARLRCPRCGRGRLFDGWFAMRDACGDCGRAFVRGPGYLLGSIYFNYGVTALLVVVAYMVCFWAELLSGRQLLVILTLVAIVFPLWFFRYARALWIAFDECFDPWPNPNEARRAEGAMESAERRESES